MQFGFAQKLPAVLHFIAQSSSFFTANKNEMMITCISNELVFKHHLADVELIVLRKEERKSVNQVDDRPD
jgi:hypothetical protein